MLTSKHMQSQNSVLSANLDEFEDEDPLPSLEETPLAPATSEAITQPEDARAKNYAIPPQLVEDVQSNPEKMRPVARSMMAVNLHNLFKRVQHPATGVKDRLEFQNLLNKMAGLEAKESSIPLGTGFSITINIPQVGQVPGKVIESTAKLVEDNES